LKNPTPGEYHRGKAPEFQSRFEVAEVGSADGNTRFGEPGAGLESGNGRNAESRPNAPKDRKEPGKSPKRRTLMPLMVIHEDITTLKVDAVVNAANEELAPGGGVCGAIFSGAGSLLKTECEKIGHCPTGEAVITYGYKLKARYVIHAVGPIWTGGKNREAALLSGAYTNALNLVQSHDCSSVAFPLISSGIYGYPKDLAFHEAVTAIGAFLTKNPEIDVYLSVFHKDIGLTPDLKAEIEAHLATPPDPEVFSEKDPPENFVPTATFKETVQTFMRVRDFDVSELARRANLKEALVSITVKGEDEIYMEPSKRTVLSMALALGLDPGQIGSLLAEARLRFDPSGVTDRIVVYFAKKNVSDVYLVSEALYAFGEKFLNA
jgi:O-acetyl-ADP-ribose deacetylase (regulator of RNase III)